MSKTFAQCRKCGHKEEVNKEFFFKIIGGGVTGGGFWAWTAYIFAGTGFALPICIAIMAGGVGIAAYSKEITEWLCKRKPCPECGYKEWRVYAIDDDKNRRC